MNHIGETGAHALIDALQINHTLTSINICQNSSCGGWVTRTIPHKIPIKVAPKKSESSVKQPTHTARMPTQAEWDSLDYEAKLTRHEIPIHEQTQTEKESLDYEATIPIRMPTQTEWDSLDYEAKLARPEMTTRKPPPYKPMLDPHACRVSPDFWHTVLDDDIFTGM
jgi:hypothetical protein